MKKTNDIMWRKITYPNIRKNMYLISENGDVKNILTGHLLSGYPDKDGYIKYSLIKENGNKSPVFAHRLVAFQFVPNPNKYPVVDHLDGDKQHNHYTNLEWVTIRENTLRAERMGLRNVRGEANGNSKWTEELVRSICEKYQDGWSIKDVYRWLKNDPKAKYIDTDSEYILAYKLKKRIIWPDVTCDYEYDTESKRENWSSPIPQSSNFKYSEEMIRKVCELIQDGNTVLDIVEIITGERKSSSPIYDFVQGIRTKRNWTEISDQYDFSKSKMTRNRQCRCLKEVADMVDEGYSKADIRKHFGIYDKDSHEGQKITYMIDRYKKAKSLGESVIIYEST